MLDGEFAKHLRRMHKVYAARRVCLLEHLQGGLEPWFDAVVPTAGIHLAARLKGTITEERVIAAARAASIGLYGIARFHRRARPQPGLMFGYGGIAVEQIDAALTALAKLMPRLAR